MNINNPPSGYANQLAWCVSAIQQIWRRLTGIAESGGGDGGSSNATELQSIPISVVAPTDRQLLCYVNADGKWEPSYLNIGDGLRNGSAAFNILYDANTGTLGELAAGVTGEILSGNTGGLPSWILALAADSSTILQSGSNVLSLNLSKANTWIPSSATQFNQNNIGIIPTDSISLANTAIASTGTPIQISPSLSFIGASRVSSSNHIDGFRCYAIPKTGPGDHCTFQFDVLKNNVWSNNVFSLDETGRVTCSAITATTASSAFGNVSASAIGQLNNTFSSGVLGVPLTVATGRSIGASDAVPTVSTFIVGATDASFEVSANVLVTTSTLHAFSVICSYTSEDNTPRVLTLQFSSLGGTWLTGINNGGGTVPYEGAVTHIRCKAGTTITIGSTGSFTTVVYNIEGIIKQTA